MHFDVHVRPSVCHKIVRPCSGCMDFKVLRRLLPRTYIGLNFGNSLEVGHGWSNQLEHSKIEAC